MKKIAIVIFVIFLLFSTCIVYASNSTVTNNTASTADEKTVGQIREQKQNAEEKLKEYIEKYGDESYGYTAYILSIIQVYSIPFCFLGIAVAAIFQYVIGIRRLDMRDKGFFVMIAMITIAIICQILPLIFALVIKGWRG